MNRWLLSLALIATAALCRADDRLAKYAFTQPPLAVFDALVDLKLGEPPQFTESERQFLAKVTQMRAQSPAAKELADEALVLEAMLYASGSDDATAHGKYHEQYEQLVAAGKEAVKDAQSDRERGEQLMRFLHAGVMSKGYDSDVTTLTAVFDDGKFNCVSSTALYCLVGSRLGLQLKPISIPGGPLAGHASLDLIDGGQRLQVEPTNPNGFDWQAKLKRPGVLVVGYVPDRNKGREVDALGLAATIYSNRGVELAKGGATGYLDAARLYAAALALDPLSPTATHNLIGIFTNWGPKLANDKRYEDAVRVLALGRSLSTQTRGLENNLQHVWSEYIATTLAAGRDQEALDLIGRAGGMIKADRDFSSPSVWFIRRAQDRKKAGGWEAGLAAVESSLGLLSPGEAQKLQEWRSELFRRWSQEHLDNGDAEASMKVLARGFALDPADKEIHSGLGYHTFHVLRKLDGPDIAPAVRHFQALLAQFPKVKNVADAGRSHASQKVRGLTDDGKFAEALAAAQRYQPLIVDPKQHAGLSVTVYTLWGQSLKGEQQWQAAIDKFQEGRKAHPQDRRLEGGLAGVFDAWADGPIKAQQWDEAIRIYDIGLADYLPGHSRLKGNRAFCEAKKAGK